MKVTGCGGGSGLSPGSRAQALPARGRGGRRGRGCREPQPSTAGEDTGRMFNQGRESGRACPDLQPRGSGSQDGRNGCKGGERETERAGGCSWGALGNAGGREEGVRAHDMRAEVVGQPLRFQHSCSVLQRLVLAPLLLPCCFQKH